MRPPLGPFVARCLAWLVPCYALWFAAAPLSTAPVAWAASLLANAIQPGLVSDVEIQRHLAAFVTRIRVPVAGGGFGLAVPEVDVLVYTHGLPLFVALMLAARAPWRWIAAGAVGLVPLQAWGVAFDVLSQVNLRMDAISVRTAPLAAWEREAIALAYQAGSLILPTLGPVALWAILNRSFLAWLAGRGGGAGTPPSGPSRRNLAGGASPRVLPAAKGKDPCP